MTDLRTELLVILNKVNIDTRKIFESGLLGKLNDLEMIGNYSESINKALTAILKLIEERYILKGEVKKSVEEIDKALKGENNQ